MLEDVLAKWGATEVSAMDVYADMFHLGEGLIQRSDEAPGKFKANPIILGGEGYADTSTVHRKILFEDTFEDTVREFQDYYWAIISGCTYFGRVNDARHQSKLCAMLFDLDGQDDGTLNNFFSGAVNAGAYPVPNYVVLSGNNVHLYYVFDEPVSLYPNVKTQMKALKYAITDRIWNPYTSREKRVQHQGINQGFRVIGGETKVYGVRARAFRLNKHPHTPEDLSECVGFDLDFDAKWKARTMTLDEAAKAYPEWYQRIVIGGGEPGRWTCKRDLYDWWIRQIKQGAAYHHRYFCILALAIYGVKCGIPADEVRRDAMALVPFLNDLNKEEPFTESDVDSALECYDERYVRFPRDDIAKLTGIPISANRRNGRPQKQHLKISRFARDLNYSDGRHWYDAGGRPKGSGTKEEAVRAYAAAHPEANHSEIARALGVSRPTVIKWLR